MERADDAVERDPEHDDHPAGDEDRAHAVRYALPNRF
jgi:hypothetical protein